MLKIELNTSRKDSGIDLDMSETKINEQDVDGENNITTETESKQIDELPPNGNKNTPQTPPPCRRHKNDEKGRQLENSILKWINKEKELLGLKENLGNNDFGDYSILMYETQDAFNHCRNLRLKLQISEEQVRIKSKQCATLNEQKNYLARKLQMTEKQHHEKERLMYAKVKKCEQRIIELYGENEFLQGKYDEMKDLCLKYRKRYFNDQSINVQEKKKRKTLETDSIFLDSTTTSNPESSVLITERQKTLDNSPMETTITNEPFICSESTDKQPDEEKSNNERRERRDTLTNEDIANITGIDTVALKQNIAQIKAVAERNDQNLNTVVMECQKVFADNSSKLNQLYSDNKEATVKLDRWIENYMILKRKTEEGHEIYQRELKKSWNNEKEYHVQIKTLCDTINQLTSEVTDEKETLEKYQTSFEAVCLCLQKMDRQIELVQELANEKSSINEGRLGDLAMKCQQLNRISGEVKHRRSGSSRKISMSLFNLKRRLNESNESGR